jgi:NitT/TauT family transport system substrate-binding protein
MQIIQSRRDFLASASLAAAAGLIGPRGALADEGPPEVTTIRLRRDPSICVAPWYIAEDLLPAEGFTDVRYVPAQWGPIFVQMITRGELDFALSDAGSIVARLDASAPITGVAGVHAGCFELFAHEPIRTISDLKGKKVGIDVLGSGKHRYVAIMAANVGLDPHKDIEWVEGSAINPMGCFPWSCSPKGRSTHFSGFRLSRRSCVPAKLAT